MVLWGTHGQAVRTAAAAGGDANAHSWLETASAVGELLRVETDNSKNHDHPKAALNVPEASPTTVDQSDSENSSGGLSDEYRVRTSEGAAGSQHWRRTAKSDRGDA
jgi:hypothetical protein